MSPANSRILLSTLNIYEEASISTPSTINAMPIEAMARSCFLSVPGRPLFDIFFCIMMIFGPKRLV